MRGPALLVGNLKSQSPTGVHKKKEKETDQSAGKEELGAGNDDRPWMLARSSGGDINVL
jgi:hypothetical protein